MKKSEIWDKFEEIRKKKCKAYAEYLKIIEDLDKEITDIQKSCRHESASYHSDPAGDSGFYECNTCGKEI